MTALFILSACEPRDIRLLQDSERPKKNAFLKEKQDSFFGDTSAALFALEKQIEIINALEMALHPESAGDAGYGFIDESYFTKKNSSPAFIFHQHQKIINVKNRQESFRQWKASINTQPLVLEGIGFVSLFAIQEAQNLTPPTLAPAADIKANVEQETVHVTLDPENKNIFNIEIKLMKITLTNENPKLTLSEILISSKMTVRRHETESDQAPRYTITQSQLSLSNNKGRNGNPQRTLNIGVSENFAVQLGACPFATGQLSLINGDTKKNIVELQEDKILNLITSAEEKLISCTGDSVRPLVDLSRILRM